MSQRYQFVSHKSDFYNFSENEDIEGSEEEREKEKKIIKKKNINAYNNDVTTSEVINKEDEQISTIIDNENNNTQDISIIGDNSSSIHSKGNIVVIEKGNEHIGDNIHTKETMDIIDVVEPYVSVNAEMEMLNKEHLTNNESTKKNSVQMKREIAGGIKRNDIITEQRNTIPLTPKQKIKRMWHKLKKHTRKEANITDEHINKKNVCHYDGEKNDKEYGKYKNVDTASTIINDNTTIPTSCSDVFSLSKMESLYNNNIGNFTQGDMKDNKTQISLETSTTTTNTTTTPKQSYIFNWKLAQKSLTQMFRNASDYYYQGVKFSDWNLTSIPTLGFSKSSNRVQLMYKVSIPIQNENVHINSTFDNNVQREMKFFVKKIPVYIWVEQFNLMNKYDGEYVTDGENFVMEAAALAFLNQYHPGITPKLYNVLYEPEGHEYINEKIQSPVIYENLSVFNDMLAKRLKSNINGHIIIISEFFNEDILDYIDRKQRKQNMKISCQEKLYILHQCLNLLIRLHNAGLSHLDLTPENILISDNYEMRLCDLAKSTPLYSHNLRHVKMNGDNLYPFESCEPTIAKGSYMPPECWKIYWRYDTMKIRNPLKELKRIVDQEKRKHFYFNVANADKFMLGVFFFWIWTNGNIWKYSDPLQDEDFFYFVKCKMDFDKFELTKRWPTHLKHIVRELLHPESRSKLNLSDLSEHPLWSMKF